MEHRRSIRLTFFLFLSLITFQSFGASDKKKETHQLLMDVNKNWENLSDEIQHTFTPQSEQELVQLHLLNVITYLEAQPTDKLSEEQLENRLSNIATLSKYCQEGSFPINTLTSFRVPIFIDIQGVHCAVGYLLKETGQGQVAKEIAESQLLAYLGDIEHPQLIPWQKASGLSMFELALIQPTYGPPIPVCASPSPIEWTPLDGENSSITQLFQSEDGNSIYGIAQVEEQDLFQEIKQYSPYNRQWISIGAQVPGQILDLAFCNEQIYISVLLPEEDFPHQLLQLNGTEWNKIAHFNGSINSMQTLENKLYVTGNFKKVNDSISTNFIVLEGNSIEPFKPVGLTNIYFDHMKASKSSLFLINNGAIYKFKNDTIKHLSSIQYFQYINNISLDAVQDTLYVTSLGMQGYNKYYDNQEHQHYLNNALFGHDYPYNTVYFTKSKKINGKMIISGDFRASTLTPQINDERHLVSCPESESAHWHGEGLLYEYGQMFYPILEEGVVLDFVQLNDELFVLKKDGSISHANLNSIEQKILEVKKRGSTSK